MLLELLVAAAASTRPALDALRPAMERAAHEAIVLRYGATGSFARQIENGAPFDLFFAADEATPESLRREGLLDAATVRVYAEGRLVLAAGRDWPSRLPAVAGAAWLASLPSQSFHRLAIGSPGAAPYGRAAKEALERAGVWDALRPRIVEGASVDEAATWVLSGNAELGLVAASLVVGTPLRSAPVDRSLYAPLRQAAGVVSRSPKRRAALRALEAVTADAARPVWERAGFSVPPAVRSGAGSSPGAARSPAR